jgi:hypothetical protein
MRWSATPDDIAAQIAQRFHPDDRLMLWFDFFNDPSASANGNALAICHVMKCF